MTMDKVFYSTRAGINKNIKGFGLEKIKELFLDVYRQMASEGFFDEYLGYYCVDNGDVNGKISTPSTDMLLKIRKDHLWPIQDLVVTHYSEDDLFDVIEYLFTVVSKPVDGTYHSYGGCGMHWHTFNKKEGETIFRDRMNATLELYSNPFELSTSGEILKKPESGFEPIFQADTPTDNLDIKSRVDAAVIRYRRHGATIDDRRQAVRDLADVLEYLRPQAKKIMDGKDESDLFNIANNFGIRHHNPKQKIGYDAVLWLSWMFYLFLSTIHLILRKMEK